MMGSPTKAAAAPRSAAGSVFLIGLDPKRPGELSWPALAALAAADAVLHDGAVDPGTLNFVPRHVLVERLPGDIARIGKLAGEGWRVVWLVSGDPASSSMYRSGAERLRKAGIATHTIAGFLSCDDDAVFGAALPSAGAVAPQPLATAFNGLAG
jgi:siroheme synthase